VLTGPAGIDPARLFSNFDLKSRACVIAAVSGGSDSTALLLLLRDYLERFAPATRLVAVTVDHALRSDSATEAAGVGQFCTRLGITHDIQKWTGSKPETGLAAAAREARHDLLARAADDWKTDLVFTGHTADDQAETVLMRQSRDQGRGLAGIAPATLFNESIWIARPLLAVRRNDLRHFLRYKDVNWVNDPSNSDDAFERPRIRKTLNGASGEIAIATALQTARDAARQREAIGEAAAIFIRDHVTPPGAGLLRLSRQALAATDAKTSAYVLRILLAAAGGRPHLTDEKRAEALLERLLAPGPVRKVLSRTLVDSRRNDVFLLREARGMPEIAALAPGAIWDGRYRIVADMPDTQTCIRTNGGLDPARSAKSVDPAIPDSLLRAALSREPAAVHPTGHCPGPQVAVEGAQVTLVPVVAPWARFLPCFDLAPANATADLLGARKLPESPLREHIGCKA
jgi:tRNA(Ile)-lysidine synthase